jgi:hypothetical protein
MKRTATLLVLLPLCLSCSKSSDTADADAGKVEDILDSGYDAIDVAEDATEARLAADVSLAADATAQ